ncbi:MAG: right-handed parallel beta-helix repeat-containing protein [Tannerella sp.]|jgi:uncharacterized repeat protein (TIGR02543 family)|nr:right-handed parallel beta-helix repeat-containing protein [Tannerella sp.]
MASRIKPRLRSFLSTLLFVLICSGYSLFAQTVTFLVPATPPATGWVNYAQKTADYAGHVTVPVPPTPASYGKVSFVGWYTTGTPADINDASLRFNPDSVFTSNAMFYAVFSNNYLVQFLDGYGKVVFSELVASGGNATRPGSGQLPDLNVFKPANKWFENTWALPSTPTVRFEFETTAITGNMTLQPILYDAVTIYFETYGTQVMPVQAKKGSKIAEVSPFPSVYSVTRQGYSPLHWSLVAGDSGAGDAIDGGGNDISTDILNPNYVVNSDLTVYLHWKAILNGATYRIVYWVERPDMGVNFVPQPGNPSHYVFGFAETSPRVGTAGQTIGNPGSGADIVFDSNDMPPINNFGVDDPMRYAEWQSTEYTTVVATVAGDNSTIVNVYCRLRTFSITFDLPASDVKMSFDSDYDGTPEIYGDITADPTYNPTPNPFVLYFKFGDNISTRWPHPVNGATFYYTQPPQDAITYSFDTWDPPYSILGTPMAGLWKSPRTEINSSMTLNLTYLEAGATNYNVTLALSSAAYTTLNVRYWAEVSSIESPAEAALPHRTYGTKTFVLLPSYSAAVLRFSSSGGFEGKQLTGMNYPVYGYDYSMSETGPEAVGGSDAIDGIYKNFYYTRIIYTLTYDFMGHIPSGQSVFSATFTTGMPLASFDMPVPDVPGFLFKGWYADASLMLQFNFNMTAPPYNLAVYARWESSDNIITFVDADGSPLANDGSQQQGVANGGYVNFNNLTIGGTVYTPGYNDPQRGAFLGWDYIPVLGTKIAFPLTMPIYSDMTLYARWQSEGLKITYYDSDNITVLDVDNASGQGYANGVYATVRNDAGVTVPAGKTFIGWRVNNTGPLYYAGGTIQVSGNPKMYPYNGALSDLAKLTYKPNFAGSTAPDYEYQVVKGNNLNLATPAEVPAFHRTGYDIIGWNTQADGLGTTYATGQIFVMPMHDQVLYAVWKAHKYNITYSPANWTTAAVGNPNNYTIEQLPVALNPPVKYGYTFTGWNIVSDEAAVAPLSYVSTIPQGVYGNLTCSPTWSWNPQPSGTPGQRGFFVDQNVVGGNHDGSSWANAYLTIEEALVNAVGGDFIWVARGEYSNSAGSAYLMDRDSVKIFGGFAAWESYISERNFAENRTVIRGAGTNAVVIDGVGNEARWDGFVIEGCYAGTGIRMINGASPVIANCIIRGNTSQDGGGVSIDGGSPILYNTEISGNIASRGAGIYIRNGAPQLTNVTVSGNRASSSGGGIYIDNSSPVFRNTIIWGNRVAAGSNPNVANIASQTFYEYSIVEGSGGSESWNATFGIDGSHNYDANPSFQKSGFDLTGEMQEGDYMLRASSSAIDRGRTVHIYNSLTYWDVVLEYPHTATSGERILEALPFDLAYCNRVAYDIVDIGAYEFGGEEIDVRLVREVIISEIEGLTTSPPAGVYYVLSSHDFTFTVSPQPGYSTERLRIYTGDPLHDSEGLVRVENPNGSITVTIKSITEPLTIDFSDVIRTANDATPTDRIWAYGSKMYVDALAPSTVRIYLLSGQLYRISNVAAGQTVIPLPAGYYTVRFNERSYKVMIK